MKLFSSGIDTSLAELFLGCQRGLTITHLCRSRGNVVVRLQALFLPFKSRDTARFKGEQDRALVSPGTISRHCLRASPFRAPSPTSWIPSAVEPRDTVER